MSLAEDARSLKPSMIWHKITDKAPEFPCLMLSKCSGVFGPFGSEINFDPRNNYTHWTPWTPPGPEMSNAMRAFAMWLDSMGGDPILPHQAWRAALEWAVRELESQVGCSEERSNVLLAAAKLIKP